MNQHKLKWETKNTTDFSNEVDFLETLLITNGVPKKQISGFLRPTKKYINDPFLLKNMKEAVELVHSHISKQSTIYVKIDSDVDGYASGSTLIQFLESINPEIKIKYGLNFEKKHGLFFEDVSNFTKDEIGLIIIPDASISAKDAKQIKQNFDVDILILDHHLIEKEFFNNENKQWIGREEAKILYKEHKEDLVVDCYTNYCTVVNCTEGEYPNPHLSGVGVVQKFIEAYLDTYEETEDLDPDLREKYLDLVSLGINADSMDLRSLENRYYVLEGMKERNCNNLFLNELVDKNKEDMKWGRYIGSIGWVIAPKINGCIRYGKEEEQQDTFRAMLGIDETREYRPRRKHKEDPLPPLEYHSLQKTMARVCGNVKARQDNEVRKFCVEIEKEISDKELDKNSVIFVDGTKILTKNTVTGLVANKIVSKYFRPVVLMRSKNSEEFGGSGRGYENGDIKNFNDFLSQVGVECHGHSSAFGVNFKKDNLLQIIEKCNELAPLSEIGPTYQCDWEIPAELLKKEYVQEVAENYQVFGNGVPEPLFAITGLRINASQILSYGENSSFIRFSYNGISYVKKYCSKNEFDLITLKDRNLIGTNKKELEINLICQFVLNSWEDKVIPEVKIVAFESKEVKDDGSNKNIEDDFDW